MTIVTIVAAWTLLSIPFGILVGKFIAAGNPEPSTDIDRLIATILSTPLDGDEVSR